MAVGSKCAFTTEGVFTGFALFASLRLGMKCTLHYFEAQTTIMLRFTATIKRFAKQGEKTGWSYVEITEAQAAELKPGKNRLGFRVTGKIDKQAIEKQAVMPMGGGAFIMPLNAAIRKAIAKGAGAEVSLAIKLDDEPVELNRDMMDCLRDEPVALAHFNSLTQSHRYYFSKWIDSAKTETTKAKRIAMAVDALAKGWGYPEMLRDSIAKNKLLKS